MEIATGIIIGIVLNSTINAMILHSEGDLLSLFFVYMIIHIYDYICIIAHKVKDIITAPLYCYLRYDKINDIVYYVPCLRIKKFDEKYGDKYTAVKCDEILIKKFEKLYGYTFTASTVEKMKTSKFKIKKIKKCGVKIAPELI